MTIPVYFFHFNQYACQLCMGTTKMIQLAQSTVLLSLLSLVATQQVFPTYSTQRIIWQQQIDKVRQAEEQLRLKSLPTTRANSNINTEQSRDITALSADTEIQRKLTEPSLAVPRTQSVLSGQKTKSKYLLQAERFLKEFREKERNRPSTRITQKTPVFVPKSYQSTNDKKYKEIDKYLKEAEEILANLERRRKVPQTQPLNFNNQRKEKYEEKFTTQRKKQGNLDQNEVKDVLLESINTKEGLKAIIKAFFKDAIKNKQ